MPGAEPGAGLREGRGDPPLAPWRGVLCTGLLLGLLLFITLLVLVTGWMVLGHGREFLIGPEGVRELSLALVRLTHA